MEKIDFITTEYIVNNKSLKFLCLTEIWYDSKKFKTFDNFNLCSYFVRKNFIRGGVGIWCQTNIQVKSLNLNQFCIEKDIEICGITFTSKTKMKHLILACYRSPAGNFQSFCEKIADTLDFTVKTNVNVILAGDFNLDPERDSSEIKILNNILSSYNIKNIIDKPTRGKYILDHIYVDRFLSFKVIDNCISDHRTLLFKSIDPENLNKEKRIIFKRNFNDTNIETFCNDIKYENWDEVYNEPDADQCFNTFYKTFMLYFDKHFPLKKYTLKEYNKTWVNTTIRNSSKNLKELFKLKKNNLDLNENYKIAKKTHFNLIRETKRQFFQNKIMKSTNISKCSWKIINEISNKKK